MKGVDFSKGRVTVALCSVDMRCGYQRLADIAYAYLGIDVSKGGEFVVFISRTRRICRIIFADERGANVLSRTLHDRARFTQLMGALEGPAQRPLSARELERYLDGEPLEGVREGWFEG